MEKSQIETIETIDAKRIIQANQKFLFFTPIPFLLLAIVLPHPVWNIISAMLVTLLGLGTIWAYRLRDSIHGARSRSESWISVGDELVERFTVENRGWLPAIWLEIEDYSNIPGYRPSVGYDLGSLETYSWRQSAVCLQRGRFVVGPWEIRTGDPFGLFDISITYPIVDEIIIYPPITAEIPFDLPAGYRHGLMAGHDRVNQVTLNVSTVREYRLGDPIRWIHWPTTAKMGSMTVREFDIDAAGDVWILLDLNRSNHLGDGVKGTEEQSVLLASALTAQAIRENRAVGLAGYGAASTLIYPGKGIAQQWRLLHALATIEANGEIPLSNCLDNLKSIVKRGSAIVILTPLLEPDLLPSLSGLSRKLIRASIVHFNRDSYSQGGAGDTSTDLTLDTRWLGYTQFELFQGDISLPDPEGDKNRALHVTPMGRAVRQNRVRLEP